MIEVDLYAATGEKKGKTALPETPFAAEPNTALLWEACRMYLAARRQGTAKTKTKGEVSGTGRKPWPQKHTGRARVGQKRNPVWVKGGVVFGPTPRDYRYEMPRRKLRLALASALAVKARDGRLIVVEKVAPEQPRTRTVAALLRAMGLAGQRVLLLTDALTEPLKKSCRNIPGLELDVARNANAYRVLAAEYLLVTEPGLAHLAGGHNA